MDAPLASEMPRYRVAFVNTHPIQYFAPLYRYLQQNAGFEVTALYFSDVSLRGAVDREFGCEVKWDTDLLGGYNSKFMGSASTRRIQSGFFSMVVPEIWHAIRRGKFDAVVIHGHYVAGHHLALAAARSNNTPVFARGDTNGFHRKDGWQAVARRPILSSFYSLFDGVLSVGTANELHYRSLGVPSSKIFRVPFTVDNEHFSASVRAGQSRSELRSLFDLDPKLPAICFAAKLAAHKRPHDVLTAYAQLLNRGVAAQLVFAGAGELEAELRERAAAIAGGTVSFLGFVNQSRLPALLAGCDAFVLASDVEAWGLAVNEAMCAGLPIICSRESGCSHDLVRDGVNGRLFRAGDIGALAEALIEVLSDQDVRERYGDESRSIIGTWSFAESAVGLRSAISTVRRAKALESGERVQQS